MIAGSRDIGDHGDMKQHLATLALATTAATTASLAVQQTTVGPIPQPTIVEVQSRIAPEDMVLLRIVTNPSPPGTVSSFVVPSGKRLVVLRAVSGSGTILLDGQADGRLAMAGEVDGVGLSVPSGTAITAQDFSNPPSSVSVSVYGYLVDN